MSNVKKNNSYTPEEIHMAIGTIIEYGIPEQRWTNYTKPGWTSKGKLLSVDYMDSRLYTMAEERSCIVVYDTIHGGEITAPYTGIKKLPFIDAIKETKLYKMVKE